MKDYYKILGVPPDASDDEIREAYYRLAHKYHPDKGGDPEKFKEINEAYQVLSDREKRKQYDMFARAFEKEAPFDFEREWFWPRETMFDFEDLEEMIEDLFGIRFTERKRRKRETKKGADIEITLEITLEEAFTGKEFEIEIDKFLVCQRCQGKGTEPGSKLISCSMCGGTGEVQKVQQTFFGTFTRYTICPACKGEGSVAENPCNVCRGEGRIKGKKKVKIFIPAGVDSNQIIKIAGEGDAGRRGGKAGDLYVRVLIKKHPFFERRGDDLLTKVEIGFTKAVLGGEVDIKNIDGKKIVLKIPPGTQPGTIFRIPQKGFPHYLGLGRGDLKVEVKIKIPKNLTKKQRELLEKLKEEGM